MEKLRRQQLDIGNAERLWLNRNSVKVTIKRQKQELPAGLLWRQLQETHPVDGTLRKQAGLQNQQQLFEAVELSEVFANLIPEADVKDIVSPSEIGLLLPVPIKRRMDVVHTHNKLVMGANCRVGDVVTASDPQSHNTTSARQYEIRWKGELRDGDRQWHPGVYFGLMSLQPASPPALSCFSDVLQPNVRKYAKEDRAADKDRQAVLCTVEWIVALQQQHRQPAIRVGDRVVEFLDSGQRAGAVTQVHADGMAEVAFDPPPRQASQHSWSQQGQSVPIRIEVPISSLMLESELPAAQQQQQQQQHMSSDGAAAAAATTSSSQSVHHPPPLSAGSPPQQPPPSYEQLQQQRQQQQQQESELLQQHGLELGAAVVIAGSQADGILRWCGRASPDSEPLAGVDYNRHTTDVAEFRTVDYVRRHVDPDARSDLLYVPLRLVQPDPQFLDSQQQRPGSASQRFGDRQCEPVPGDHPPVCCEHSHKLVGRDKGVQGHHNSCYLDATLFAMFAMTSAFDSVLQRKQKPGKDIQQFQAIQQCLKCDIVNCLRHHKFVRADHVIKLRQLLNDLGKVPGMLDEEKDPEEFINLLLDFALKHQPFIELSTGQSSHVLQLFLDPSGLQQKVEEVDTQMLLHLSLIQSSLKLKSEPPCLILQMPRSGRDYKLFPRIIPVPELDISNLLTDHPRQCSVCGKLATLECSDCFLQVNGLNSKDFSFCDSCHKTYKEHKPGKNGAAASHKAPVRIEYHQQLVDMYGNSSHIPDVKLRLSAVICIHTSHYVCFLRCQQRERKDQKDQKNQKNQKDQKDQQVKKAKWLFFDSMADRVGLDSGYNVPEVTDVGDIDEWLSARKLKEAAAKNQQVPESVRRLLSDCYLCFYESDGAQLYK